MHFGNRGALSGLGDFSNEDQRLAECEAKMRKGLRSISVHDISDEPTERFPPVLSPRATFTLWVCAGCLAYAVAHTYFPTATGIVVTGVVVVGFVGLAYYAFRHSFSRYGSV
jgi:hypothetical protein